MFAVTDERLEELIKKESGIVENCKRWNAEFSEKQAIERLSALKELLEMRTDHEELKAVNAQYEMDCVNIDSVLADNKKTIEELRQQNKLLIGDGGRLAKHVRHDRTHCFHGKHLYSECKCGLNKALEQHKELMEKIEV